MANLNPKTGATIGYQETKGTTAEPFNVPMLWQPSSLSYVSMTADVSGNLNVTGGGGGGGNPAAGLTGAAVPTYGDYIAYSGAGGLLTGVSAANPLPCTFTGSAGNAAAGATGVPPPGYADNTGFTNAGGNLTGVSAANPLPVTFTGSAGNAAAGLTGAAVPTSADYGGWNSGGNLVGTSLASALPVQPGTGATFPVSGTFWQATQPVSGTVAATQSGAWTVAGSGTFTVSGSVTVSNFPGTQPVSGTVTANQGTANATPWNENVAQFGGSSVVTGTGVSGAGIPRVTVSSDSFPATQPVSGTVAVSGNVTVVQPTGTNLHAVLDSGTLTSITNPVTVAQSTAANLNATVTGTVAATQSGTWNIGSITTLPAITGTVTANQGTANATPWNENVAQWAGVATAALNIATGQNAGAVAQSATYFGLSTVNSSTAQLAANATFTGTIETILNQQAISMLLYSDQPGTLQIQQFIDAAGTQMASNDIFPVIAGLGLSQSVLGNGNYARVIFTNNGTATTTLLNINTYYGTLPPTVQAAGVINANGVPLAVGAGDNNADNDPPAPSSTANAGKLNGLMQTEAYPKYFDGTYWQRVRGTITGGALVQDTATVNLLAPLLEAVLQELRIHSVLLSQNNQPIIDDIDRIRGDINLSLN